MFVAVVSLAAAMHVPAMGSYRLAGRTVYVGVNAEPPDQPTIQYYDSKSHRMGTLDFVSGVVYRTNAQPWIRFSLAKPTVAVREQRFVLGSEADRLGASLWFAPKAQHRATIVLIQGADDSTRQMGFLIPYFVAHGLNVVTYDQRGTGDSVGNWRYTSPASKAADILTIIAAVRSNAVVDPKRIGAWAASNGGWVAPIVATHFPLAFLILKSAPSESIASNVLYEIGAEMQEAARFTPQQMTQALAFERTMFATLTTNTNWGVEAQTLSAARTQPWFGFMRIPPGFTAPPPAPMLAALRASLVYDPTTTLERVTTPTLALFGALDKNVNAQDSAAGFRRAFTKSGMRDFTIKTFPNAGHLLVASTTGYEDQPILPVRYVGYPEAMIRWLRVRGFTR